MKNKTTLILFFLLISQISFSQVTCFDTVITESIISITDDAEFIWCGTEAHGLLRIRKSDFEKEYWNTSNSNISGNRIKSVLMYNDQLYFSSDSTLMGIEDNEIYPINEEMEGRMLEDLEGNLLVAGRRDFYKINSAGAIIYHQNLMEVIFDACCSQTTSIAIDANENIWLSHFDFYEYDVLKLSGNTWSVFDVQNSILPIESWSPNQITSDENYIYATNGAGLFTYEDGAEDWTLVHTYGDPTIQSSNGENLNERHVLPVSVDQNDNLWVAGNKYGDFQTGKIAFQKNEEWYILDNGSDDLPIINLFQEARIEESTLYVGTETGLIILDKNCVISLTDTEAIVSDHDLLLYPIPGKDLLNLKTDFSIEKVAVYDALGKFIFQKKNPNPQLDLSKLLPGTYLLKVYVNGTWITRNFIKE